MNDGKREQLPRNAWTYRLRDEAQRARRPEVAKAAHVGVWLATYADPDGGGAFPSGATLAAICGCTRETVTRAVNLLMAVGMLERRKRPNKTPMYQLLLPVGRIDWDTHMDVWGESRQAAARRKAKTEAAKELARKASRDGNRKTSGDATQDCPEGVRGGIPEDVRGGHPDDSGRRPRTHMEDVPGRIPEGVRGGGDQDTPTYGRDPLNNQGPAEDSPQPQKRAGARETNDESPREDAPAPSAFTRCTECGERMIRRADRTTHSHCTPADAEHRDAS